MLNNMEDSNCNNLIEDMLSSELTLHFIQYLNVADSGRLACSSQRFYYLVHQFRRLKGPEIVTTTSRIALAELEKTTPGEQTREDVDRISNAMLKQCKQKIQAKPNLILGFSAKRDFAEGVKNELLFPSSPNTSETISLHAVAHGNIQAIQPASSQTSQEQEHKLDCECQASLMAMNFPGATMIPFAFPCETTEDALDFLEQRLRYHSSIDNDGNADDRNFWKGIILYSVGDAGHGKHADQIARRMQKIAPNAVIIGGVCQEGFVSTPTYTKAELNHMSETQLGHVLRCCCDNSILCGLLDPEAASKLNSVPQSDRVNLVFDALEKEKLLTLNMYRSTFEVIDGSGVFGVCLGGNVPIKSAVSLGVHSVLNNNGPPRSFSNLVVHEVSIDYPVGEDDQGIDFYGSPTHEIRVLRDKLTGELYLPIDVLTKYHPFHFVGIKRPGGDGFQLLILDRLIRTLEDFSIATDGSDSELKSLEGAEVDFFSFSGEACVEDMNRTMLQLRQQTQGEEILGALIYTCQARGPDAINLPQPMSDATQFSRAFPSVPCTGFYAAGELGPVAMAGSQNVFQTRRAVPQGFTAVFALFIVPIRSTSASCDFEDSIDNVRNFVRNRLQPHSN